MTASPDDDKQRPASPKKADPGHAGAQAARHPFGPRSVGAVLPPLLRPAFKRRSPVAARIMTDWADIVGPVLAVSAVPRRLTGGTLVLACSGPMALELQHLSDQLTARINAYLGAPAISRIRLVQEALPPPRPAPAPPKPDPALEQQAADAVCGVPDGPLRHSLLRLGLRVLRRPS